MLLKLSLSLFHVCPYVACAHLVCGINSPSAIIQTILTESELFLSIYILQRLVAMTLMVGLLATIGRICAQESGWHMSLVLPCYRSRAIKHRD